MKTIAVLLTVFNRRQKTLDCLERLNAQLPLENYQVDVFLTDDGCTDGTPEAVSTAYPDVHIIHGDGSLFWNRGMYTAWQEAAKHDYDYYLWLNDDTFVYPDMLSVLIDASESQEENSIIVGPTQAVGGSKITYGGRLANGEIPVPAGSLIPVNFFNGNIVLIPRSVYSKLGNLDYYFRHSKGDFDYGMRAYKAGIGMFQAGKVLGVCDEHESMDKWCDPKVPFAKRWSMLHRPNGMPPKETFHLDMRHKGLATALFHYCTVYTRCIFPWVWTILKK